MVADLLSPPNRPPYGVVDRSVLPAVVADVPSVGTAEMFGDGRPGEDVPLEVPLIPLPKIVPALVDVAGFWVALLGAVLPFMRLPTRVFNPFSSVPRSFSRSSLFFFCASNAWGIRSRRLRMSSAFRLASSSRLRSASFNEVRTVSSSPNAESSRFVLFSSASFNAVVSVLSWSRRANALSKLLSISDLSCSS